MTASLSPEFVEQVRAELDAAGLGGWLLYDFHARNAVAGAALNLPEGQKRRYFVLLSPDGPPHAIVHKVEEAGWQGWEHSIETYVGWEDLRDRLGRVLTGLDRVAMEVYENDGVPYVDNVPAGVVQLIESLGPEVVSSVDLISRTAAQWGDVGRALHWQAARILADTAEGAFRQATAALRNGETLSEFTIAQWVRRTATEAGLTGVDTIVAVGPNAALPHYEPLPDSSTAVRADEVFLVDLWGKVAGEPRAIFADQTWMGWLGPRVPDDVQHAWQAVADSRDAAVAHLRERFAHGPSGADVDLATRAVLIERGYEEAIFHRTGHGIDREIHGIGPSIDSIESDDQRELVPGVGFSIEPGVYLEGRFGIRSEINVLMTGDGPEVSPDRIQHEMWVVDS